MLQGYLSGSDSEARRAVDQLERLEAHLSQKPIDESPDQGRGEILFLVSATHTGTLCSRIIERWRISENRKSNIRFLALFRLGAIAGDVDCLRDLSDTEMGKLFVPLGPMELPDPASIVEIHPVTYFPSQFKDVSYTIEQRLVSPIRKFIDSYPGQLLFRVHKEQTDDEPRRHMAIWVDTTKLVRHAAFKPKLELLLDKLEPTPDIIIAPNHVAALALTDMAKQFYASKGTQVRVYFHKNLQLSLGVSDDHEIQAAIDSLPRNSAILFLDDCFVTGSRLVAYQANMRLRKFEGRLHYIVALARPRSMGRWKQRKAYLQWRSKGEPASNTADAIEAFPLPDWSESECPWCQEVDLYDSILRKSPNAPVTINQRPQFLRRAAWDGGIESELFLAIPGYDSLKLTKDSLFAHEGAPQATVFAAVASALQNLRDPEGGMTGGRPPLGPRRHPIATVIDHEIFSSPDGIFSDAILRSCVLRAAQGDELIYTNLQKETCLRTIVSPDLAT